MNCNQNVNNLYRYPYPHFADVRPRTRTQTCGFQTYSPSATTSAGGFNRSNHPSPIVGLGGGFRCRTPACVFHRCHAHRMQPRGKFQQRFFHACQRRCGAFRHAHGTLNAARAALTQDSASSYGKPGMGRLSACHTLIYDGTPTAMRQYLDGIGSIYKVKMASIRRLLTGGQRPRERACGFRSRSNVNAFWGHA